LDGVAVAACSPVPLPVGPVDGLNTSTADVHTL